MRGREPYNEGRSRKPGKVEAILATLIMAAMILAAGAAIFYSPVYSTAEFEAPLEEGHHLKDGMQMGSRVGVDCTPAGCVSGSTMEYSFTDNQGKKVYWSRGCDKAPDGDVAGTGIKKADGRWVFKRDPDGAYGSCANLYVHVGREPKGHRGVIWNNGGRGIDVYGRFSCHRRSC